MKYIQKNLREPQALKEYRETTPNATYGGYVDTEHKLKEALLEEQGYICAYCMGKISNLELNENHKPKIEVEHLKPQKKYPHLSLDYSNMLAVCNGLSKPYPHNKKIQHCDKTEDGKANGQVELQKLNPLNKSNSEDLLMYDLNGKIKSKTNNEIVENDLNTVLNLNNDVLIKHRRVILDKVKSDLMQEKPMQQWTQSLFDKHLSLWQNKIKGKYRQYCMVAIWFLNDLKTKPRYQ
jgi:uncharacterized protein (TIGR02646 family)